MLIAGGFLGGKQMRMDGLHRLNAILGQLGPGLTLAVDRPTFAAIFGAELRSEDGRRRAWQVAELLGCVFESDGIQGRFRYGGPIGE